jgi:hypothetical protein
MSETVLQLIEHVEGKPIYRLFSSSDGKLEYVFLAGSDDGPVFDSINGARKYLGK